jgi:hypothetical protein
MFGCHLVLLQDGVGDVVEGALEGCNVTGCLLGADDAGPSFTRIDGAEDGIMMVLMSLGEVLGDSVND